MKRDAKETSLSSPIEERDKTDSGDEVLRRFRYQFAYGVILLLGAATRRLDYRAIWCEQHEDFLAEVADQIFDAYQIKTRKPELGAWELNDEAIWKSIARFVDLDRRFPGKIRFFKLVSNAEFSDSSALTREHLSPVKLRATVRSIQRWEELSGSAKRGFEFLNEKIGATPAELFTALKRLDLVQGPTDRAFEDEICQTHIPRLPECSNLSATALARIREALITRVGESSSLFTADPARHWVALNRDLQTDPLLLAKYISVEDLTLIVREARGGGFEYLATLASLKLGRALEQMDTLEQKLVRGGLAYHYEMMRRRALSAEQMLLDLATRPADGLRMCSQLENIVFGECDDARLRASQHSEPFGTKMLIDVQDRLKKLAQTEPERVHRQPYDLLVGVVGLLTSECKVWWSKPFQVEGAE